MAFIGSHVFHIEKKNTQNLLIRSLDAYTFMFVMSSRHRKSIHYLFKYILCDDAFYCYLSHTLFLWPASSSHTFSLPSHLCLLIRLFTEAC